MLVKSLDTTSYSIFFLQTSQSWTHKTKAKITTGLMSTTVFLGANNSLLIVVLPQWCFLCSNSIIKAWVTQSPLNSFGSKWAVCARVVLTVNECRWRRDDDERVLSWWRCWWLIQNSRHTKPACYTAAACHPIWFVLRVFQQDNDPKLAFRQRKGCLTKKESDGVLRQSPNSRPAEMVWEEFDCRVIEKQPKKMLRTSGKLQQ